jgi:two-component system, LytTR family, sensor kinase
VSEPTGAAAGTAQPFATRWRIILAAWTLMGLFLYSYQYVVSTYSDQPFLWWRALIQAFANAYLWAAFTPAILWLSGRVPIRRATWLRATAFHLAVGAAFASVGILGRWLVALQLRPDRQNELDRFFASYFHFDFEWYWIVVGVGHALDYYGRYHDRALRTSQLEAQLATAQLQALRMQLQPHFLFNTLHVISELVHEDPHAADRMITRLGDLLRLSVDAVGTQEVTLRQELEFLEAYLEIEKTRFGDRLTVDLRVDPVALDAKVPNLVLQPLVENAIRHGLARRAAAGRIEVSAARSDGELQLVVRDNGAGLPPNRPVQRGVGLRNTGARLRRMYGADQYFDVRDDEAGGVVATVVIPFHVHPDAVEAGVWERGETS